MFKGLGYEIACVDFDGTLCSNGFPLIGLPNTVLIDKLKEFISTGGKWILWTCRTGYELEQAIEFCNEQGIKPDAVNEYVPDIKNSAFGRNKSVKAYCDLYVDDKNVAIDGFIEMDFSTGPSIFEPQSAENDRISGVMGFLGK